MPEHDPVMPPALSLTRAEADGRMATLAVLKEALAARGISSALVGRRTLVLRLGECRQPAGSADSWLSVFAADAVDIVTTDVPEYRFASGLTHPAIGPDDPTDRSMPTHGHHDQQ